MFIGHQKSPPLSKKAGDQARKRQLKNNATFLGKNPRSLIKQGFNIKGMLGYVKKVEVINTLFIK